MSIGVIVWQILYSDCVIRHHNCKIVKFINILVLSLIKDKYENDKAYYYK